MMIKGIEKTWIVGLTVFCLLFSLKVPAQIYSYKDNQGRIIYSDQPPEAGEYEELQVKSVNQLQIDQTVKDATEQYHQDLQDERANEKKEAATSESELAKAKKAVKNAQNALINAANIQSGDIIPNKGGGIRYTQQYKKRILDAEKALQKARESLKKPEQRVELAPD